MGVGGDDLGEIFATSTGELEYDFLDGERGVVGFGEDTVGGHHSDGVGVEEFAEREEAP